MTAALAAADLAVGRAGARPSPKPPRSRCPTAIVPYPHAAGHQRHNAEQFAAAGAAILVEDEELDGERLLEVASLLADPARHAAHVGGRAGAGRPSAADAVADLVLAVAHHESLPTPAEIDAVARGAAG